MMQIYIKNSKLPLPEFVQGLTTKVIDYACPPNSDGQQPSCAYVYWRHTSTRRRVDTGKNSWDLFAIEPQQGYEVSKMDEVPGTVLGRYDGQDIGFTMLRIVAEAVILPNETVLPPKTERVVDFGFLAILPKQERGIEGSVFDAFDYLPFHQPGGNGSMKEECPRDLWERELVSYFAHGCPDAFRAADDKLAAAKENLFILE